MPDGKPDLSGFWAPAPADPSEDEPPQGLPWAEALVKERIANDLRDMPNGLFKCNTQILARVVKRFAYRRIPEVRTALVCGRP
jgi:hypothetical protein